MCTKNRVKYFGKIVNGEMVLSNMGIIARDLWKEIPCHFNFVKLDEFVVMPDHVHGIIIVESPNLGDSINPNLGDSTNPNLGDSTNPNLGDPTSIKSKNPYYNSRSLGLIINQYKRACTIKIRNCGFDFQWQSRYYERIIMSDRAMKMIGEYVKNNPGHVDSPNLGEST